MSTDVTREDVLAAIAEFDEDRERFLARHAPPGYVQARNYLVVHNGRLYDSGPLLAAAHSRRHSTAVTSRIGHDEPQAAARLLRLGFRLTEPSPPWTELELGLLCETVADRGWERLRGGDAEARALSGLLRAASDFPADRRNPAFRSPDSVARKSAELVAWRRGESAAAVKGSRLARHVVADFLANPDGVRASNRALRASIEPDGARAATH